VAVVQQPFANVRTDEARPAGDQKVHGQTLAIKGRSVEFMKLYDWISFKVRIRVIPRIFQELN
jgi:hypothetical protein